MEVSTSIDRIEQTGDWFKVFTTNGLRLDTKRGEVAFQAQQLQGQQVVVEYTERTADRINEHTGRPFVNRYLESVRATGGAPSNVPSQFAPTPQSTSTAPAAEGAGARAGRNNLAAAAVEALIQLSDGQPQTIQRLLDGLARWSETGEPIFTTAPAATYTSDSDIPF